MLHLLGKEAKNLNVRWYLITFFFNDSCLIKDIEDNLVFAVYSFCTMFVGNLAAFEVTFKIIVE